MKIAISALTALLFLGVGSPFVNETLTPSTVLDVGLLRIPAGYDVKVGTSAAVTISTQVRFSKSYLVDSNFEDYSQVSTTASTAGEVPLADGIDAWDVNGALQAPWKQVESGGVTVELDSTTSKIQGSSSLRFENGAAGLTALNLNGNLDTGAPNAFTNWTINLNGGSGTVLDGANFRSGARSAKLTGGSAHVDFTNATVATTAGSQYTMVAWGRVADPGDNLDVRIDRDGGNFLQADGTWGAGEVNFCRATFQVTSAFQFCTVTFTTAGGSTTTRIWVAADTSGDIGEIEDAYLITGTTDDSLAMTKTRYKVTDTASNTYALTFQHKEADIDAELQYALINTENAGDAGPPTTRWYTGTAWSATETWFNTAPSLTAAQVTELFEADATAGGHNVQVRFRILASPRNGDIFLDTVDIVESALTTDALVMLNTPLEFKTSHPGRVVAVGSASATVYVTVFR